jgi:hypothetical protein
MAARDPFDLLRRLGTVPIGPLVDTLRQLHQSGTGHSSNLEALLGTGSAATDRPAPPIPPVAPIAPASPDYEAARKHFVRHSERLREQALLAERLLDGLAGQVRRTPAVLQHELRVQCPPRGTSAARFVVVNCLEQPVDVHFRTGRFHGLSAEQAATIHLSFSPAQPHLEPGAEKEVQLQVDLQGSGRLPDVLEVGVDVLGGEEMLLKIWARIELRQEGAE